MNYGKVFKTTTAFYIAVGDTLL